MQPALNQLNQAGLFSGEGGTGKSILELTKNVAHVIVRVSPVRPPGTAEGFIGTDIYITPCAAIISAG
jgi:hypothetical protein